MNAHVTRLACALAIFCMAAAYGAAQERPAPGSKDPRVGLKAGIKDAGVAISNMELIANVPKPPGFFDPKAPAGEVTEPEPDEEKEPEKPETQKPGEKPRRQRSSLNHANSDLAFQGTRLFAGNFSGFNIYDIAAPKSPKLIASIVCPGGQGDVSIYKNLLFMSVEQTRGRVDCGAQGVQDEVSLERFVGVRIFDITDLRKPKQIAAVQTCRGSHTHTLLVDPKDTENIYVYGSGTSPVRAAEELPGCSGRKPDEDPDTALFSIDVIKVPLSAPHEAKVVNRPRIFADPATGAIAGLQKRREAAPGVQPTRETDRCHDITVYPEIGLAAGACAGNGILLDISDPVNPVRLDAVADKNFAFWHSATFNNDGTKVIFTDEWGGGTAPRCRETDLPEWGANAIFDIVDRKLQFRSYYKMPAAQTPQENCVAHNGSLVPVPGRDIMVQSWYQGGISVFDFTDSSKPVEIAYFDRGPVNAKQLITAGHWSAYWYNGHVYGAEIARGIDVLRLTPSEQLTASELEAARLVHFDDFNAQQQPKISWPAHPAVARAYVDQLERTRAMPRDRLEVVRSAVASRDRAQLETLSTEIEKLAAGTKGRDAERLRALAATLKGLTASER